jgi:zinc D-Ala-D-Ala carboxypeptidase
MAQRQDVLIPASSAATTVARRYGWAIAALLGALIAMTELSSGPIGTPSSAPAPGTVAAVAAVGGADPIDAESPAPTALLAAPSPLSAPALSNDRLDTAPPVEDTDPPACTFGDDLATDATPADWGRTLVDTDQRLPADYVPPDLVPTSRAGIHGGGTIRAIVIPDLRAMAADAAAHGHTLVVVSAYRSYHDQQVTFARG